MVEEKETERKILDAARKVFLSKGLTGARMQDIADEAGINKALLHYYYRSKEKLFELIFREHKQMMFENIVKILESDKSVIEKVEMIIDKEQDSLQELPSMPLFIMNEIHQNPDRMMEMHSLKMAEAAKRFFVQIEQEVKEGKIKPISPMDLYMNLISLNVFPYLSCPMFMKVLDMTQEEGDEYLKSRRRSIKEFMINALKP